jgi:hypothetical protein
MADDSARVRIQDTRGNAVLVNRDHGLFLERRGQSRAATLVR